MSKLMVTVYLPAAEREYDLMIPADLPLSHLTPLAARALSQVAEGLFIPDSSSLLCQRDTGEIFNINMTPYELGLRNGSRLMLI